MIVQIKIIATLAIYIIWPKYFDKWPTGHLYIVTLTVLVTLVGAAEMYAFEKEAAQD